MQKFSIEDITQRFIDSFHFLKEKGLIKDQKAFAELCGAQSQNIYDIFKGKRNASQNIIINLIYNGKINPSYLYGLSNQIEFIGEDDLTKYSIQKEELISEIERIKRELETITIKLKK